SGTTDNFIMLLNGIDHIQFRHLGFVILNTYYSDILDIRNGVTYLNIENCLFDGTHTCCPYSAYSIYAAGAGINEYLTFRNNYFKEGLYAIRLLTNVNSEFDPRNLIIEN